MEGENFGHICSKYSLEYFSEEMLKQMIQKTTPKPSKILLDWKGMPGGIKQQVLKWSEETGILTQKVR